MKRLEIIVTIAVIAQFIMFVIVMLKLGQMAV
mgnify:FL=1